MIRKATVDDLSSIHQLSQVVKQHMLSQGLNQWVGDYPIIDVFTQDLQLSGLYVFTENNQIIASISILPENDPPYQALVWDSSEALVIHRILVDPKHQGKGIGKQLFAYAIMQMMNGYQSLKVDTHPDNIKMQTLIKQMGFSYKGYLSSINRLAYEKSKSSML